MRLKPTTIITALACLFTLTSSVNLEARHKYTTSYVEYVTPVYHTPQYVVHSYQPQPVYVQQPVHTVVYRQDPVIYRERVVVHERSNPAAVISSFALGLGLGLLR